MQEKSNINLKSNLMLKSRIGSRGFIEYAPVDLAIELFPYLKDNRTKSLTPRQEEQRERALWLAKKIVDID
jgi:hypothetical protein